MASSSEGPGGRSRAAVSQISLKDVTLCAATSINVEATIAALAACLNQIDVADCILLTDATVTGGHDGIRLVRIAPLKSSRDYSDFILNKLIDHVDTSHCLIVQWDGFVLDARAWQERFLEFDYIGAPWPQFEDGHNVGNGGFSLRSRRLLEACRDSAFVQGHPEDVAICRTNRQMLERKFGIRFAGLEIARRFALERGDGDGPIFGFHGVFNMVHAIGPDRFWELFATLDDRSTAFLDYPVLMAQIGLGTNIWRRRFLLTAGFVLNFIKRTMSFRFVEAPAHPGAKAFEAR